MMMSEVFFFFNDTATTEIYTLSLHDALPILASHRGARAERDWLAGRSREGSIVDALARYFRFQERGTDFGTELKAGVTTDRKSTRLNSSHANISYAVFCLKKKNNFLTDLHDA